VRSSCCDPAKVLSVGWLACGDGGGEGVGELVDVFEEVVEDALGFLAAAGGGELRGDGAEEVEGVRMSISRSCSSWTASGSSSGPSSSSSWSSTSRAPAPRSRAGGGSS
jgi:hypothetical protein